MLYAMGFRYPASLRDADADRMWADWIARRPLDQPPADPYMHLVTMECFSSTMSREYRPDHTLVNSINHFLDYTRRLRAAPPAPFVAFAV